MAIPQLHPNFREFLKLLSDHGVEYLLIGGYAVGYHGYPRATGDMEVWVARDPGTASKLVTVLLEFGFDAPELCEDIFLRERSIVRMGLPPYRIEVSPFIDGVSFLDCYERRETVRLDGVSVDVISLEDLKTNKLASGRLKDLADLESLP